MLYKSALDVSYECTGIGIVELLDYVLSCTLRGLVLIISSERG